MRALILLPALLLSAHLLLAQNRTAADLLHAADSVCAAASSAIYDARLVNVNVDGRITITEGRVYMKRYRRDQAVGFKARIELAEGDVITYDGANHLWLSPRTKKLWGYDPDFPFTRLLEGSPQGKLVALLFHRDYPLRELDSVARYDGTTDIAGTPCIAVRAPRPDNARMTMHVERWCLGRDDGMPRRFEQTLLFDGLPYADTMTVTGLRLNAPIPDSLFTARLPAGFSRDTVRMSAHQELLAVGTEAPGWTLKGIDGKPVSLATLRGRVVVLDFWYMSCPPCLGAMPKLSEVQRRFDTGTVMIIGVNGHDQADRAARFIRSKGFRYRFLFDGGELAKTYRVSAYPTFYVIGRDGRIAARSEGAGDELEAELLSAINGALR